MAYLFLFFLLFKIEEPIIEGINYPESQLKLDIKKRVVADLKVKMEIDEKGIVQSFDYIDSENIEKERIEYFFKFFKDQLLGRKVKPMKKDGKPVACTYIYIFSWVLYYPPPEVHYVGTKGKEKLNLLKTLSGDEREIEEYEKYLIEKAKDHIKPYGLGSFFSDGISYHYPLFLKEIKYIHLEILSLIDFFKKIYSNYLKENLNFEQEIFFFPNSKTLSKMLKEEGFPQWADGLYIGPLKLIFSIIPQEEPYWDVFLHEEAHFLINYVLFENKNLPLFLKEGLAENLLFLYKREFKKDKLQRWEEYKRFLKIEKIEKNILSYLFLWDPDRVKKERESKKFYAYSWAFIEFLSKGENFPDFINRLKKDGFSRENFEECFGKWEGVEKNFLKYIKEKF